MITITYTLKILHSLSSCRDVHYTSAGIPEWNEQPMLHNLPLPSVWGTLTKGHFSHGGHGNPGNPSHSLTPCFNPPSILKSLYILQIRMAYPSI